MTKYCIFFDYLKIYSWTSCVILEKNSHMTCQELHAVGTRFQTMGHFPSKPNPILYHLTSPSCRLWLWKCLLSRWTDISRTPDHWFYGLPLAFYVTIMEYRWILFWQAWFCWHRWVLRYHKGMVLGLKPISYC